MRLKCTQMEVCILTPPATNQILKGYSSKNYENTKTNSAKDEWKKLKPLTDSYWVGPMA